MSTEQRVSRGRGFGFATHVVPALAYALAVFYAGLIRLEALPEVGFVPTDKLLHTVVFGGFSVLLARAVHFLRPTVPIAKKLVVAGAGSSLLGLLLELCQALVPYRSADPWDWIADTVGAALATGLTFAVLHWVPRRAHG